MADHFAEDAIKVGEGLETDFIGDFAHAQVGIDEEVFGLLDAHAGEVVGEIEAGGLFEHFAEIEGAGVHGAGAVEYSLDGGKNWLPILYMIDSVDLIRNAQGAIDVVETLTTPRNDAATYLDPETGADKGGNYGGFIGAPITQALAPYISGRIDDNQVESKRVEFFPLPDANNQKSVTIRFTQAGTASWFFGVDDFGVYSIAPQVTAGPTLTVQRNGTQITISWPGTVSGFVLESNANLTAGNWTPVAGVNNNSVTLSAPPGSQFYRLRKP